MKAKVDLKVTGVRGGSPSWNPDKGMVVVFVDGNDDYISVDAFQDEGEKYKRRGKSEIEVRIGSLNWKGTKEQLAKLLTPKSNEEKIFDEMGHYLSDDRQDYPKILVALKKALKKTPDKMVDDVEFDNGTDDEVSMETITVWEKLEYSMTVKSFCDLVGIYL